MRLPKSIRQETTRLGRQLSLLKAGRSLARYRANADIRAAIAEVDPHINGKEEYFNSKINDLVLRAKRQFRWRHIILSELRGTPFSAVESGKSNNLFEHYYGYDKFKEQLTAEVERVRAEAAAAYAARVTAQAPVQAPSQEGAL